MRKVKTYRSRRSNNKGPGGRKMRKTLNNFLSHKNMNVTKFQSSATWQNTITDVKFPKAKRFFRPRNIVDCVYDLPTTKTRRGPSFGYGQKQISTLASQRNAKFNPSPDRYAVTEFTKINKTKKKGKTFGIQHSYRKYNKRGIMPQLWIAAQQPGPCAYEGYKQKVLLKKGLSYTMRDIGIVFNDKKFLDKGFPSPDRYGIPGIAMSHPSGFKKVKCGLGLGNKKGFKNTTNLHSPGPGTYTLPSFADKIIRRYSTLKGTMNYNTIQKGFKLRKRGRRGRRARTSRRGYEDQNAELQGELKSLIKQKDRQKHVRSKSKGQGL